MPPPAQAGRHLQGRLPLRMEGSWVHEAREALGNGDPTGKALRSLSRYKMQPCPSACSMLSKRGQGPHEVHRQKRGDLVHF